MNTTASKWHETDFAVMTPTQLDQAHQDLAAAWSHYIGGDQKRTEHATAKSLQKQMRAVGYLINPATETGLRRLRESGGTQIGISIAPAEEFLPEVRASKHRKGGAQASAPIDAADRAVKAAKTNNQRGLTERERQLIDMRAEGVTRVEMAERLGVSAHAVDNAFRLIRLKTGGTVAASTELTERDRTIIRLRREGVTWPEVGDAVGCSDKAASNRFYLLRNAGVAEAQI